MDPNDLASEKHGQSLPDDPFHSGDIAAFVYTRESDLRDPRNGYVEKFSAYALRYTSCVDTKAARTVVEQGYLEEDDRLNEGSR